MGIHAADLVLRYLVRWLATRLQDTLVDRDWPLHLARLWHEPQPTTVSHEGGCADRSGARMPRCTPTGLSHVIGLCRRPDGTAGP